MDTVLRNLSLDEAVTAAEAEHTRLNPKSAARFRKQSKSQDR